jgi:hypothetical protein
MTLQCREMTSKLGFFPEAISYPLTDSLSLVDIRDNKYYITLRFQHGVISAKMFPDGNINHMFISSELL